MQQMCGSSAEPRLPQTQKFMKHREVKKCFERNIGANTDDPDLIYNAYKNFCLSPFAWLESWEYHAFYNTKILGHSLSPQC